MSDASFEQVIAERGELYYTHVGVSMYPLLKPRDLLRIKAVESKPRRLDVVLYKRDSGQYVLHRILKVRSDDYIICGDNCLYKEEGITDRHIFGILTEIVRNGKTISVYSFKNRLYAHLICDIFVIRRLIFFVRRAYRWAVRKVKHGNSR